MLPIFTSQLCCLGGLYVLLEPQEKVDDSVGKSITPKQRCENWFLTYGIFWIACFTDPWQRNSGRTSKIRGHYCQRLL